jgi:hypothetical protein
VTGKNDAGIDVLNDLAQAAIINGKHRFSFG